MKKLYLLLFIGIIILPEKTHGQEKIISYITQNRVLFSIPKDTEMQKITDLDLARMEIKEKLESKEVIISKKDLTIEIVTKKLNGPESLSDKNYGVESTITNLTGIEHYNYRGELIYSKKHENPNEADFYILPEKMYSGYGFYNNLFEVDIDSVMENFRKENYTVVYYEKENVIKAYNELMQLYINMENLFYETLLFENNELKKIDYKHYIKEGDHIVPFKESYSSFEYTINGICMLRTNETTYIEYSVTEGDSVLYERSEKQQNNNKGINFHQYTETDIRNEYMKIYPNPAQNVINIELPFIPKEKTDIEIIDILGNIVLTKNNINSTNISIDISGLINGSYILNCKSYSNVQSIRFIKN